MAERAVQHAAEVYQNLAPEVATLVRNLILGDIAAPVEDENMIHAVITLAFFDQEHLSTDSNGWKSYFLDWALDDWVLSAGGPALPEGADPTDRERIEELISWALLDRPLIGETEHSEWSFYGYLTHAEVGELLGYAERYPGLQVDEHDFGVDFFQWLSEIHTAGLDYWFNSQ